MISVDQLKMIADRLLQKTRQREVDWKAVGEYRSASPPVLMVGFPKSQIRMVYQTPRTDFDHIALQVCNQKGELVAEAAVSEGDPDWPLVKELYDLARQYATGGDEVFNEILQWIGKPGKIGV